MNRQDNSAFASTSPTLRQLNPIDGCKDEKGELNVGRSPVLLPPGDTNVSFEQFADSLLCSWPVPNQTGSIFWTLGIPTQMMAIDVSHDGPIFRTTPISIIIFHTFFNKSQTILNSVVISALAYQGLMVSIRINLERSFSQTRS